MTDLRAAGLFAAFTGGCIFAIAEVAFDGVIYFFRPRATALLSRFC